MEQYWINRNGQQSGPFDLEQLRQLQLDGDTYVWYNGLEDWEKLESLPQLVAQLQQPGEPPTVPPAQVDDNVDVTPESHDVPMNEENEENEEPEASVPDVPTAPPAEVPAPPAIPATPQQAVPVRIPVGIPTGMLVAAPQAAAQPAPAQAAPAEDKCPPTNLVWAIITAVLCCLPLSLVAVFMSIKVKTCWEKGEAEQAQKWSDRGAWFIIASIIAGIVVQPIVTFIPLLFS